MNISLNIIIIAAMAFAFGCSRGGDDIEKGTVATRVRNSIGFAMEEFEENGVEFGINEDNGTTTTYSLKVHYIDDNKAGESGDRGFVHEYDFKVPEDSGIKSQYVVSIWQCYADALADIANSLSCEVESVGPDECKDLKPSGALVKSKAFQVVPKLKVIGRKVVWEGNAAYAIALAVQACRKDWCCEERGKSTISAWAKEACRRSLSGPATYEDGEGVAWTIGIVPVDEKVNQSDKAMSDKLAYSFAATMRGAKVSSTRTIENKFVEDDGVRSVLKEYRETTHIKPAGTIDPNDDHKVKRFIFVANHPQFGRTEYRVCAIRD